MECFNGNANFAVLSGTQNVARVREQSCGLNSARALVDLSSCEGIFALVLVD